MEKSTKKDLITICENILDIIPIFVHSEEDIVTIKANTGHEYSFNYGASKEKVLKQLAEIKNKHKRNNTH